MKKLFCLVLCLCMLSSILSPSLAVSAAQSSKEMTFNYAYDVQRSPAYPTKQGDTVTVSRPQAPLRNGASATSGVFRYSSSAGEWTLTEVGAYGEIGNASPSPSSYLKPVVSTIANTYGISDMNGLVIHKLTDPYGKHVAYGVIICEDESNGYALLLADQYNEGGAGYFLSVSEFTGNSITFHADKIAQTSSNTSSSTNTSSLPGGYFQKTLYLDEYPVAGNKPHELTCDQGNDHITYQQWSGNFDANGCFIAGEDYTLTAEYTIKEKNRDKEHFDTTPGKFQFEFSVLGDYNNYYCDILSISPYVVKGSYTFHCDGDLDFQPDQCGTGVVKEQLSVYEKANTGSTVLGKLQYNDTVKVIRSYVNGYNNPLMHMIEYNGKIGYIKGRDDADDPNSKFLMKIKVDGAYGTNSSFDLTPDFGEKRRSSVTPRITRFTAEYGTKPEVTLSELSYFKAESIVYSTEYVTEKFGFVTVDITFVPVDTVSTDYYFKTDMEVDNGEVLSVTEDCAVVRFTAFTGNGDKTASRASDEILRATEDYLDGPVNRAYAKAKVNSMGGNAKMYTYPHMASDSADPGEEIYILDEAISYKIPGLDGVWYAVSKYEGGTGVHFMPAAFIGEIEYLDTYMPGAPGVWKNGPYSFAGGSGTIEDPFLIETADQLNAVRFGMTMHYKLIADIDLSNWGNWVPIGGTPAYGFMGGGWSKAENGACSFLGSFDGNGHVISGMQIIINEETPFMTTTGNWKAYGLFGNLATNPDDYKIKNLGVVDFTIDVTYSNFDQQLDLYAAAICGGMNNGMDIYNCYSKGGKINFNLTGSAPVNLRVGGICSDGGGVFGGNIRQTKLHIEKCFNDSDINVNINVDNYFFLYAGGIIASMDTTHIHECYNSGDITLPVNEGDTKGSPHESMAAGICSFASIPEIPNIYHKPPESASFIQNCYNSGNVTSRAAAGIFLFSASDIHIENCYNVGKIHGNQLDESFGYPTTAETVSRYAAVTEYGTEFIRNCTSNGNAVSGSMWQNSSLGRKVLAAHPEDKMPNGPYNFAVGNVGSFTDVKTNAWYAQAVEWAVRKKVTTGTSATTFTPDATCTRAQILTFLWRAAGSPKENIQNPFTDVSQSDYYYDAALWAYAMDMVDGPVFAGDTPCTRAATVIYLWKNAYCPAFVYDGKFADVTADSECAAAVEWALYMGVTSGTSDTTFSPDTTCTRGQIATFLYRTFNK